VQVVSVLVVFTFATWEEYYLGTFTLPLINGPNEGLVMAMLIYLCNAVFGGAFWLLPSPLFGVPYNLCFVLTSVLVALSNIHHNASEVHRHLKETDGGEHKKTFGGALWEVAPVFALVAGTAAWVYYSPSHILEEHSHMFVWALGALHCKLVMHIMVAHIVKDDYQLMTKSVAIALGVGAYGLAALAGVAPVLLSEYDTLRALWSICLFAYLHMVHGVVTELCTILNIKCFTVKPKPA
jgi:ethanolaminephosphotransferase